MSSTILLRSPPHSPCTIRHTFLACLYSLSAEAPSRHGSQVVHPCQPNSTGTHTSTARKLDTAFPKYKARVSLLAPRHQRPDIVMFSLTYSTISHFLGWLICIMCFSARNLLFKSQPISCPASLCELASETATSRRNPSPGCLEETEKQPRSVPNVQGVVKLTFECLERLNCTDHAADMFEHLQSATVLLLDLTPPRADFSIGPTFYRFAKMMLQRDEAGSYCHLPNLAILLVDIPKGSWAAMRDSEIQGTHNSFTAIHNDHLAAKTNSSPGVRARPLLQISFPSQVPEVWQRCYCGEPTE
jgi:hypothetical protein